MEFGWKSYGFYCNILQQMYVFHSFFQNLVKN